MCAVYLTRRVTRFNLGRHILADIVDKRGSRRVGPAQHQYPRYLLSVTTGILVRLLEEQRRVWIICEITHL